MKVTRSSQQQTGRYFLRSTNTNNNNDEEDEKDQQITALKTELATKDEKLATKDEECQRLRADIADLKEAMVSLATATVVEDRQNNNNNDADLGRDVLEVLGNLIVTDVMNENEVLRHREKERLLVTVTGRNGTPVYFRVLLTNGNPVNDDHWLVSLSNAPYIPLNSIRVMEIWLGDTLLHCLNPGTSFVRFDRNPRVNGFDRNLINVPQMGNVCISTDLGEPNNGSPVPHCMAKFGPILYHDFVRVLPEMNDATRRMSTEQLLTLFQNDAALPIGITGLCFRNSYIGGAISILKRCGISTTTNDNDHANDNENDNENDNGNDNNNDNGNDNNNGNGNDNGNGIDNGNANGNGNGNANGNHNDNDNDNGNGNDNNGNAEDN